MIRPHGDWMDRFLNIHPDRDIPFKEYIGLRLIGRIVLGGSSSVVFFLLYNLIRQIENIPYVLYTLYFFVAGISVLLIRAKAILIGKIAFVLGCLFFLFTFAITAPIHTGTHLHLILLVLLMIALVGAGKQKILLPTVVLVYLFYLLASFPGFDPFQRRVFSESQLQGYFILNSTTFFVMYYLIIWWILDLHRQYENDLKHHMSQVELQRDQMGELNKNLDKVVYTVTHDLRAPLNSLLGLLTLMESANKEETLEYRALMQKQIAAMKSYIQEIVEYNRNAKTNVEEQAVVLADLIQEVIDTVMNTSDKKLQVDLVVPRQIMITSDPLRVKVILSNLISNSAKYSDPIKPHKTIKIEVKQLRGLIETSITDNGIGIAEEHLAKIFDMFYRATDRQEGTGLGLFIVKETIEKLGGQISVSSELGVSTTFKFTLPA